MGFSGVRDDRHDKVSDEEMLRLREEGFDRYLPYPVSSNKIHTVGTSSYGSRGPKRIILSGDTRKYYQAVKDVLYDSKVCFTDRLSITLEIHDPDRRKRDINNYTKSLFDALQHAGVFVDDSQIDETHIYRKEIRKPGCVRVVIREIGTLTNN